MRWMRYKWKLQKKFNWQKKIIEILLYYWSKTYLLLSDDDPSKKNIIFI